MSFDIKNEQKQPWREKGTKQLLSLYLINNNKNKSGDARMTRKQGIT